MGKFDKIEQSEEYQTVKRVGDTHQQDKLPMKDKADSFKVKKELDAVSPDMLMNRCKQEKDGEKHILLVFYTNTKGKGEWMRIAMPKFRARKYKSKEYFEVVDCRNGRRKTFKRSSVKTVKKCIERSTGEWKKYNGIVDTARFK